MVRFKRLKISLKPKYLLYVYLKVRCVYGVRCVIKILIREKINAKVDIFSVLLLDIGCGCWLSGGFIESGRFCARCKYMRVCVCVCV